MDDHSHPHAHEPDPTVGAGRLHEVADGVHAWVQPDGTWWLNNAGVVVGDGAALVVDTCATEARTRRFLDAVATAAPGVPVRYAVNTHEHGDHTYGNSLLPADAVLVGHESMRAHLAEDILLAWPTEYWAPVPDWGAVTLRLPDLTVRTGCTVRPGGRRVELLHPGGPAHTTGDLVAWLPDDGVLFTGDLLFVGLTPLVFAGSVAGALAALEWLAGFDAAVVVPGHGPVTAAADLPGVLAAHEGYYRFVLDLAATGRAEGLGPLEAARSADLGPYSAWADAERLVLNLHRAYAEADGVDMDVLAAMEDAVAWHGGPLTTHVCCLA